MVVTCTCGHQMSVAQEDAGRTVQCPSCGANIAVVAGPVAPPLLPVAAPAGSSGSGLSGCAIAGIILAAMIPVMLIIVGILAAILLPALARARVAPVPFVCCCGFARLRRAAYECAAAAFSQPVVEMWLVASRGRLLTVFCFV